MKQSTNLIISNASIISIETMSGLDRDLEMLLINKYLHVISLLLAQRLELPIEKLLITLLSLHRKILRQEMKRVRQMFIVGKLLRAASGICLFANTIGEVEAHIDLGRLLHNNQTGMYAMNPMITSKNGRDRKF